MFMLKKFITSILLPPGCIVMMLLLSGAWLWRRKLRWYASFNVFMALLLWMLSTDPVSRALLEGLESGLTMPSRIHGDVIILLGGGINEGTQDLTGSGSPSDDMMARIVTAVRLHRSLHVPIIVSGGSAYAGRSPEAPVIRRILVDLGVKEGEVILESQSRDTVENALNCGRIIRRRSFRLPLLVTSAYHMRRSIQAFNKAGVPVTPLPAQFVTGKPLPFLWIDCLPGAGALLQSATALKEYLGLLFYRVTIRGSLHN